MTSTCRFCAAPLRRTFVDLGEMPLANAYPCSIEEADREPRYPLHARVCDRCMLVQVDDVVTPQELFSDYAYFSSYSSSWVDHARKFAETAVQHLGLGSDSLVLEVASNDGYLLQHFRGAGVPVLGVDPAANVAQVAIEAGIPTDVAFFGVDAANRLAKRGVQADLLVANNVFAHVPDLNDFTAGLAIALKPGGVVSIEVPHLLRLIDRVAFDTIYHEHYSYFSLMSAERVLAAHGLVVYDVEQLPTHGGSLRIWAGHGDVHRSCSARLETLRAEEAAHGLASPEIYEGFTARVERCRLSLIGFFANARSAGESVVAYGAAAKGNTLLNSCAVHTRDVAYVVDRSPHKQGRFLPGSHLPIHHPDQVAETRPDYLLVLPWNLRGEILDQMAHIRSWGGRFVIPVPEVEVVP